MIEFSAKDASILARVAQYEHVPAADRRAILEQADSDDTRAVGQLLMGDRIQARPEIYAAFAAVQNWVRQNREHPSAPRKRVFEVASSHLRVG